MSMTRKYIVQKGTNPSDELLKTASKFLDSYTTQEEANGTLLILHSDIKSQSFYFVCHLTAIQITEGADLKASLDTDETSDIYKLNRDITEDQAAYKIMVKDAKDGRSFEDLVIEYDVSYHVDKPLKVYGGQHRVKAIKEAVATR